MAILGVETFAYHMISARLRTNLRQGKYVHKYVKREESPLQTNLHQY